MITTNTEQEYSPKSQTKVEILDNKPEEPIDP